MAVGRKKTSPFSESAKTLSLSLPTSGVVPSAASRSLVVPAAGRRTPVNPQTTSSVNVIEHRRSLPPELLDLGPKSAGSPQRSESRQLRQPRPLTGILANQAFIGGALSSVAGFVDAAGFVGIFGLFPAHLTGEMVAASSDAMHPGLRLLERMCLFLVFGISVSVTVLVARRMRVAGLAPLPAVLGLMTVALACFCAVGTIVRPLSTGPHDWSALVVAASAVGSMGIQNTLMREALVHCSPTTVMTGNLTQLIIELVASFHPQGARLSEANIAMPRHRLSRLATAAASLGGFLSGAGLGAWLTATYGLVGIALPTTLMSVLTVMAWRDSRHSG